MPAATIMTREAGERQYGEFVARALAQAGGDRDKALFALDAAITLHPHRERLARVALDLGHRAAIAQAVQPSTATKKTKGRANA